LVSLWFRRSEKEDMAGPEKSRSVAVENELVEEVEEQVAKLPTDAATNVAARPTLETVAADGAISRTKLKRLYAMLYGNGPGSGKFLSLPFDQRVEHGVGHQFKWERSAQLDAVVELANKGNFSALVLSMGEAEKMQNAIRPDLPLIIKVDGHFRTGSLKEVPYYRHANLGDVGRAYDVGADAVGLTFYVGNEEMQQDCERIAEIVAAARDYHLPVVIWAYPRGPFPDRVGVDSLYWCHNAVSYAQTMGADIVKTKFPEPVKDIKAYEHMLFGEKGAEGFRNGEKGSKGFVEAKMKEAAWGYWVLEHPQDPEAGFTHEDHVRRLALLMRAADRVFVVFSGGPKVSGSAEEELTKTTKIVMDAGAEGRIIGRNFWGVPIESGLALNQVVTDAMADPVYDRKLKDPRFTLE